MVQGSYYYRANLRAYPPKLPARQLLRGRAGYAMLFSPKGEARPLAFQETLTYRLSRDTPLRCQTAWQDDGLLAALGLRSEDGSRIAVLLCSLTAEPRKVALRLTGLPRPRVVSAAAVALDGYSTPLAERPLAVPEPHDGVLALRTQLPPLATRLLVFELG